MAMNSKRGFTLLIAVIFMSVVLAIGLSLASLGYKQEVLATSAIGSEQAFYAADAALECVLYADEVKDTFNYSNASGDGASFDCEGASVAATTDSLDPSLWKLAVEFPLDADTRCADVTIYKYSSGTSYLFSQGYNVSCESLSGSGRFVARGLEAHY